MPNDESLRTLRHDLRHALYVLDLGFSLLEESRLDEERFVELMTTLRKEQKSVVALVETLLGHIQSNETSLPAEPPAEDGTEQTDEHRDQKSD